MNGTVVQDGEIWNPSGCVQMKCDNGFGFDVTEQIFGKIIKFS